MQAVGNLLDAMSAASFKTENGRTLYFPNGVMGSGYVVPDSETEAKIRGKLRTFYGWFFGFLLVGIPLLNIVFSSNSLADTTAMAAVALFAVAGIMHLFLSSLVSGLEKTGARMGLGEAFSKQARATPRWFAIFQVLVAVMMAFGGMLMLMDASDGAEIMGSIGVLAFGFTLLAASLYTFKARLKA